MSDNVFPCPVCSTSLSFRLAHSRKTGKPFVMIVCPVDGRHMRGFIADRQFVSSVVEKLEHKSELLDSD